MIALGSVSWATAFAASSSETSSSTPPGLLQNTAPPVVMLTIPKDHQLFFKAYSDIEDLDPDAKDGPEISYKPTFLYTGYFDNKLCYKYNTDKGWFEPKETAVTMENKGSALYCNTGTATDLWSGNFLNWAAMTRIDILRMAFYGGKRVKPQPTDLDGVLLERSHIPGDAHSFAKYYGGADLPNLTPYQLVDSTRGDCSGKDAQSTAACNLVSKGITLCNTTSNQAKQAIGLEDGNLSQNTTNPPLIRVARGNFSLWSASERVQCKYWDGPDFKDMLWTFGYNEYKVNPGNSALLDQASFSQSLNALMNSIFGSTATPSGFYFFHDSPTVNVNTDYVAKYEPKYTNGQRQDIGDFKAYVVACDSVFHNAVSSGVECKKYGTKLKPVGILQDKDFADKKTHWGLVSGSFSKNKTGGALRKNIAEISDEIDENGDFKTPATGGIIAFLDNLRIVNWGYMQDGVNNDQRSSYVGWAGNNCGAPGESGNYGKKPTFNDGECVSWGNPLSEILLEAYRYLAGKKAPSVATTDETFFTDTARKNSMTSQSWGSNPLATAPTSTSTLKACSPLQVLAINASSVSNEEGDLTSDLFTSIAQDTSKVVGDVEIKSTAKYFVGDENGNATASVPTPICTAKTISDFSKVRGTCPDAPALGGSYLMAGMAWRAYTTPDINKFYGKGIRTSGVSLELGRPIIELPYGGETKVQLLPACRNLSKVNNLYLGSCALVDFKILKYTPKTIANETESGTALVIWEDSQQGSDFDQDVTQLIEYSYTGAQVTVTTKVLSKSTNDTLELGYIIKGVEGTKEGPKNPLLINAATAADNKSTNTETYNIAQSNNVMLEPPLYYAAKWGGFKLDERKTIDPNTKEQWDVINNNSSLPGGDNLPDNYFVVRNPSKLASNIKKSLETAQPAVFGYTSVGSVSSLDDGTGFSLVTQFRPAAQSSNEHTATWTGSLKGYFRGPKGYLIEDSNKSGNLDSSDLSFALKTDKDLEKPETYAYRFTGNAPDFDKGTNLVGAPTSINKFNFAEPFFSAEAQLAMIENYSIQSEYPITSGSKTDRTKHRYIFTSIDSNNDQLISGAETATVPFDTATGFSSSGTNNIWLDFAAGNTSNLVDFIRGKHITNYRDRRIDFVPGKSNAADGVGTPTTSEGVEPWLLGDIVNSSPLVVSGATAGYDTDYGDVTYTKLRDKYTSKSRRNVLYVGANDGMLHAFNLGFFNPETKQYEGRGAPIGAELWAYIPFNLLPHLKWLTETDYHHNFYMDGRVKLYDANIFTPDDDHPEGWGSILVATMRTGGAPYELTQNDASGNPVKSTLRSAVVVMDVTNPEAAPQLIAEIPLPDNTYTTNNPDIVKFREFNSDGSVKTNNWYLVIGSGVTDRTQFTSEKIPKLFVFDLIKKSWVGDGKGVAVGTNKGWIGGLNSRDWDRDYKDDYVYFGTVEGTPQTPSGRFYRAKLASDGSIGTPTPILGDTSQAFASTPFTVVDTRGKYWVFAGTGRYFSDDDNKYRTNQNSYYAIKEQLEAGYSDVLVDATVSKSSLVDLTGVNVLENDQLETSVQVESITASTRKELISLVDQNKGWYFNFGSANARNYTSTILSGNSLVFNTYEPGDECTPYGESKQYRRDFLSGLPSKFVRNSTETKLLPAFRDLGIGAASDPTPGKVPVSGTSLGAIDVEPSVNSQPSGERQSWRELPYSQ